MKKLVTAAVAAASVGMILVMPSPAVAGPAACGVSYDYGLINPRQDAGFVGGVWYNCSGSTTDYVYLEVNNASDGECIAVSPGSRSYWYDPTFWVAFVDHTVTWKRC